MNSEVKVWPKISIVTPNYNGAKFIEETINSIISQEYPNLEYIIIDGGSTDGSVDIIKKYESHLTYWISEKDSGQSEAINKGLSKVTGEIFNWINSDDLLEPGALEIIGEICQEKNADVIIGQCKHFKDQLSNEVASTSATVENSTEFSLVYYNMGQPAQFYSTSIINALGGVNESMQYSFDLELWFRYLAKHGIGNVKKSESTFANFRLHSTSKTVSETGLFKKEDNQVFYQLLKSLECPEDIHQVFQNSEPIDGNKRWDVKAVNSVKFLHLFSERWFTIFYLEKSLSKAQIFGFYLLKCKFRIILFFKLVLLKLGLFLPGVRNNKSISLIIKTGNWSK